ncbi:hypothetical protein K1T71_012537 [Dendrolimus kikuchii]|uniref:Uncharacterized protein n=1 Tax=Dendrolimus kikuchii TaxID=765133 RepID=A0ACC1CK22_9NEOP|nr:hypothetical protein K1T71_012537 [Dendrolimus kikuchii]
MLACEKNPKNRSTISCIDKYTVQRKKGRYMLKMRQDDGQELVVVPWEDSFPFVWNCHAGKGHLSVLQTHEAIKSKYVVESVCVEILTQICSCSSFNKYVYLSIVELATTVKDSFTHILLYEDCYTGYVHIKPIPNISVNEIALELIKIFCDIGPPFLIYSKVPGGMDELSEVLNSVWKQSNIIIYVFNTDDRTTSCKILELMSDWLTLIPEGGKTYYYGWHVIQHKYNNINHNSFGLSPFERAFPYLKNTTSSQVVLSGQTHNTDWSKIEEVIDIDEKVYIIEINDLSLTAAEGEDTTIDDTAEKETSDQSKKSNNEDSDKDDDIEIIENKTELIILNDDDDDEEENKQTDDIIRSYVQLCIRCKMNIEGDVNICERCSKSVHERCSLINEQSGSLFCLPCTEILTHIDALTKRKEEYKWLLECMNDDDNSLDCCRIYD